MYDQGQLLVQLDHGVQQAQLAQAQAATADSTVRRQLELQAQGLCSGSSVEQAQSAAQVAQAQMLARAQLARLQVRAPFSGRGRHPASQPGRSRQAMAPPLHAWRIRASCGPTSAVLFQHHAAAVRFSSASRWWCPVDALPGTRLKAVVAALDAQADADGRALRVRAALKETVPHLCAPEPFAWREPGSARGRAPWVPEGRRWRRRAQAL